jgi:uncharacterized protein (DUF488 family)
MEVCTIGVYEASEEVFFGKLVRGGVDTFCDIRQRRSLRGAKYAFANSRRLQERLYDLGIAYMYVPSLAPTTEIRILQREEDIRTHVSKRERNGLGAAFMKAYRERILCRFDFDRFFDELERITAHKVVFFCVEEHPESCHRSLVATEIHRRYNCPVIHL